MVVAMAILSAQAFFAPSHSMPQSGETTFLTAALICCSLMPFRNPTPAETPDTWWFILLSGAIAICAMILPGISGAFILLLLGKYQFIMQAVGDLNVPVIVIFVVGAAAGIISFSHLLSWLLKHWHDVTVAVLMGFMVGSLNKVWPWKEVVETYTDSHGKIMPLVERNIAPGRFEALAQQDALLGEAVVLCLVGFLTIYCIELAARIVVKKREE